MKSWGISSRSFVADKMKKKILFRADANSQIGAGHLNRALALAQSFSLAGFNSSVIALDSELASTLAPQFDKAGIPFAQVSDENAFQEKMTAVKPALLFVDLRELPTYGELVEFLKSPPVTLKLISMDGFFSKKIHFDLIIYPYSRGHQAEEGVLCGPQFSIYREELARAAVLTEQKSQGAISRVLVSMGGSDPKNYTPLILKELCPHFPKITFTAVIGPGFQEFCAPQFSNLEIVDAPDHLGGVLAATDLAITAGGLTKYETALFGVPSLILPQTAQEESLGREFSALNTAILSNPECLREDFERLINDLPLRKNMADNGRKLVDTEGKARIIDYIQKKLS
jgi:UDP-2,4-diacetamido-2,4,6-trideoxy-beta-L-altropyranose hydrolase